MGLTPELEGGGKKKRTANNFKTTVTGKTTGSSALPPVRPLTVENNFIRSSFKVRGANFKDFFFYRCNLFTPTSL